MSLTPGARLGPYEITAQIGMGGMGEVYRATDTNLKRPVAIKVLPEAVATDGDRLARFQREAEVLARLNHPNIAQIHGLEKSARATALVMELVEGPTLSDQIAQGPIPLDEALPIARQIAEALEAAHDQGIIHRDLKPANIKLRPDGTVKVLDFGLAKALDLVPSGIDASQTITSPAMTQMGAILGTAAYMSPEQAKGKTVDKRTDIWAFGCVLFEMLTGTRAFDGDDVTEVLARIIEREPDFTKLPQTISPAVRRLLRRSLEKDRRRRLADASDARIEIDEASTATPLETTPAFASPAGRRQRLTGALAALGVLVIGALAIPATLYLRRPAFEPVVTRLDVVTPPTSDPFSFALSPDGRQLAFVASAEGVSRLWVRLLDQVTARPLQGTEGANYPFWSPDGRALGFFADGKLKRIDIAAGATQVLAQAPGARGGTWNRDGMILFGPQDSGLLRVAATATGGTPTAVTRLGPGHGSHRWPQFLPDGRRFLFFVGLGQPETHGVYLGSLDGGEPTRLLVGETAAQYVPPGYLLRVQQGVLVAHRFDVQRGVVSDESVPLALRIGTDDGTFHSAFTASDAGVLAHRPGTLPRRQLVWVDRTGTVTGVIKAPDDALLANPQLAPDDRRVAVSRAVQGNFDVWLVEVGRSFEARFTFDPAVDGGAVWSPDGSRIVFQSARRTGVWELFDKPATRTADDRPLAAITQDKQNKMAVDWSPDGRFLLYASPDPKTGTDLWALPMTGDGKAFPVVQTRSEDRAGQFSPDGRWIAYVSNETGSDEVYIQPFSGPGGKIQISTTGGIDPRWRRDGRELFFIAADGKLMAVPTEISADGRSLNPGAPVALFPTRLATGANITVGWLLTRPQYAVARDGRFLMNVAVDTPVEPITIVLNWDAELKK